MLRALSVRRDPCRYERLRGDEATVGILDQGEMLKRAKSVPAARDLGSSKPNKLAPELAFPNASNANANANAQVKPTTRKANILVHPLFSLFDRATRSRKRKKNTVRPEFIRYLQYVREGGLWDVKSNMPVIYYK